MLTALDEIKIFREQRDYWRDAFNRLMVVFRDEMKQITAERDKLLRENVELRRKMAKR